MEEALALAEMADQIAEQAPKPHKFRCLLRGLTAAALGNAKHSAGIRGAEAAFRRSDELWKSGAGGDPTGLLDGARRLGLLAAVAQDSRIRYE